MANNGFESVLKSIGVNSVEDCNKDNESKKNSLEEKTLSELDFKDLKKQVFEQNDIQFDKKISKKNDKNIYTGHRQRARERFLLNPDAVSDYDLVELLLFLIIPRVDTKQLAKTLVDNHKTLKNIFNLSIEKLEEYHINSSAFKYLTILFKTVNKRLLKQDLDFGVEINNLQKLVEYCQCSLSSLEEEQFRILFFNSKLKLIDDVKFGSSGVSSVTFSFRDIAKKCIDFKAKSVVIYHNHPNQDPIPSQDDIAVTNKIIDLLKSIEVEVVDHIIVSGESYFSFKQENLF